MERGRLLWQGAAQGRARSRAQGSHYLHANGAEWAEQTFGQAPAQEGKSPAEALDNRFKVEAALDAAGAGLAAGADANHLLYLVRAVQLASADPAKIKTPTLIIYTPTDLIFPPDWVERT